MEASATIRLGLIYY